MKSLNNGKALIIGVEKVTGKELGKFPDLKVIGVPMTGLDHLPWKEIKKRDIKVISLRDFPIFLSGITSTAEHTFGLILALTRNYKTALNAPYRDRDFYRGHTLSDKVLGIIGCGRVGKQLKKMAVGFSMTVITHDKNEPYLNNLLEESDIISLHIPLPGNEGFFTKEMFQMMKPTSYLINTSRDGVIEKGDLLYALQNGIIAGAAIDFIDDPDLVEYAKHHNNLILTNHIGGATHEDMARTEEFIINQINNYLNEN